MAETLKDKTAKGLFWGGISTVSQQVLNLFFGIFLARILNAEDYGMVGMLAIFSAIASSIQESGFTAALTNKRDATHQDYNAVFWFSTLTGSTLYIILFFCAPLIGRFFHTPQLIPLARFLFLGFLIASTGIAHNAILFKNLKVKEKAKIDITALIVSGTAGVLMALNGLSYWGIAAQSVLYISSITVLRWHFSPWRPTFNFNFAPIREMLPFSIKLFLTNIVNQVNANIFSVLLGRFYSKSDVGYYAQGNKWMIMGQSVVYGMVANVAQPIFSQINDDPERQIRVFRKIFRFTVCIALPAMTGLAFIAQEFITLAIGAKWLPAVPILQILCLAGFSWILINLYSQVAISKGRSNLYFWCNLLFGAAQILIAFFMLRWGILRMVFANALGYVLLLVVWQCILKRLIGLRHREVLRDLLPYLVINFMVFLVAYLLTAPIESEVLSLVCKVLLVVIFYIGALWKFNSVVFKEIVTHLKKMF